MEFVREVRTAINGEDALGKINQWLGDRSSLPDIMFIDINMPIMNGFEFLEEFKTLREKFLELNKIVPIVMLTSSQRESDREKAMEMGIVDHFYLKSHDIDELKSSLQYLINETD